MTVKANPEAERLARRHVFRASLNEAQWRWLQHEARRLVDHSHGAKSVSNRRPLYEAEEAALLDEWMARTARGERMPEGWAL